MSVLLTSCVSGLFFVISLHSFYENIHAHNEPMPSFSKSSRSISILRVGVPWRTVNTEFVSVERNGTNFAVGGFCVKVFEAAIKTLNYSVHYIPFRYTDPHNMSYYDYIIHQIVLKNLDAVVGDFTITSKRSQEVLFTQPFLDSGLVAVVPLKDQDIFSLGWAFLKPFTAGMWLLTAGFFFSGGMVVYLLERRTNPRFQGQPRKQFGNVLWFGFSTWFTNQDDVRTVMARVVVVAWLFVIGVLYSCYTANLSAILTAPRLEPTLKDLRSVVESNVRIGYQKKFIPTESFVEYYGIANHRLVSLRRKADNYYNVLSRGDVGAVVDELPYMKSLVAKHCSRLAFASQTFTPLNWAFAFDRVHYELVNDISIRILELSENGQLHTMQSHWLPYYHDSDCSKYSTDQPRTSQLQVQHFWGLFLISGSVSITILLLYMVRRKWNSSKVASPSTPPQRSIWPRRRRLYPRRRLWPILGSDQENSISEENKITCKCNAICWNMNVFINHKNDNKNYKLLQKYSSGITKNSIICFYKFCKKNKKQTVAETAVSATGRQLLKHRRSC